MSITFNLRLDTCLVHRTSLVNGACYLCEKRFKTPCIYKFPSSASLCLICHKPTIGGQCCDTCILCPLCARANRLPGVCSFCTRGIFNQEALISTLKHNPQHLLSCLVDISHKFISKNSLSLSDARNLIPIVLSYL